MHLCVYVHVHTCVCVWTPTHSLGELQRRFDLVLGVMAVVLYDGMEESQTEHLIQLECVRVRALVTNCQ